MRGAKTTFRYCRRQQRGAALIVSMLMLLVMTLIGITGMQTSILEEKMAGNYRDSALAFQAAETALRDAEEFLATGNMGLSGFSGTCANALCDATAGLSDVWDAFPTAGVERAGTDLGLVSCQPRYWIEGYRVRPPGSASWESQYRITAIGCGRNSVQQVDGSVQGTRAMVQSVYRPPQ
jgi:type IV pilus assembly protein PilX